MDFSGKDINVELLRITACFLVIVDHIKAFDFTGDTLNRGALLVNAWQAPCVGIFFLMSGFFLSRSSRTMKIWRGCARRVIFPAILLVFATGLMRDWLASPGEKGNYTLLQSVLRANPLLDLKNFFFGVLAFDAGRFGKYTEHLWYIFSYIVIMAFIPLILGLIRSGARRAMLFLAGLTLVRILMVDLNMLWPFPVELHMPAGLQLQAAYAILGYLLYYGIRHSRFSSGYRSEQSGREYDRGKQRRLLLFFLGFYLLAEGYLIFMQFRYTGMGIAAGRSAAELEDATYFCTWLSGADTLAALGLSGLVLTLPLRRLPELLKRLIVWTGSYTYPIFLLHFFIAQKLRIIEFEARVKEKLGAAGSPGAVVYAVLYGCFVFLLTLLLAVLLRQGVRVLTPPVQRLFGSRRSCPGTGLHPQS